MIISGTGHRPNKLGGYSQEAFNKLVTIAENYLKDNIPDKVISGMALGWDQALAQACINLKIPFIAAIPCFGQDNMWPNTSRLLYHSILNKASEVIFVSKEGYNRTCMQKRNKWMVDNSDLILTIFNGSVGGTANCINYAKSKNKKIINLYDKYNEIINS